jgi:hypothetical protein
MQPVKHDAVLYVLKLNVPMDTVTASSKLQDRYISPSSGKQQLHLHIQITDPWLSSRNSVSNGSLITQVN